MIYISYFAYNKIIPKDDHHVGFNKIRKTLVKGARNFHEAICIMSCCLQILFFSRWYPTKG